MPYLRGHLHLFLKTGQGLGGVQVRPEDDAVGPVQQLPLFLAETPPGQADGVEAIHLQGIAEGLGIGQNVLLDRRRSAHDAVAAHPGELVDRGQPADDGKVLDDGVAGQGGRVGQDHIVAHRAFMGHVGIGHQQAVVPDFCHLALQGGEGDCDELPDHGLCADDQLGLGPFVFQILGVAAEGGSVPDLAALAQLGPFVDGHRRADDAAVAQRAFRADDGEGADRNVVADPGRGIYNGGGMDLVGHVLNEVKVVNVVKVVKEVKVVKDKKV